MTERDKQEAGSKFWNKGKWDNFVLPFLPEECSGMTLIDMGCNAGIFLKLAEDKGFDQVIGVDANRGAIRRAFAYRERNGGKYEIYREHIQRIINALPAADYTILANVHYYFPIDQWLDYLDKLQYKTRYCVIVTAHKECSGLCKASPLMADIRSYFKNWDEAGIIDNVSMENDPFPRQLWSVCFKSRFIDRVPINDLENQNNIQESFYVELDQGIHPTETKYYKYSIGHTKRRYRGTVHRGILRKVGLYESIKNNRLMKPVIINRDRKILEGNHRHAIMKHLGHKTIMVRIV